ncbi:hypothetical protein BKA67DRAFT_585038 [Truncatella angustata]|uniref:Uncharacterized protein n=1 Tax=Truncatella angustata TaxID=152316 RepID=A0A9P8RLD2_9PEZI|nr:uncharacterized protein BKA67DRAFT_585038 [Truncatella angustata]KAH6645435.1 hypothetical protein BKA67DRAFT_585038 [Truncatella angustata]
MFIISTEAWLKIFSFNTESSRTLDHLTVPPGQLMFGETMAALPGCWTRPTDITQSNRQNIHEYIFILKDNHEFIAYEYRDGAGP